ncbi:MAG: cytochrome c oxidase subunit 3 [Acidimicrobiaceae bacterium]|nr:cytochrome c oxidase subunit 3 [Acidimicrobiaceae bacterium]MCY4176230.1 cytochrome c oxidase subunit 3 [Acidimicrobiaceae bacterium]MCY4280210.1 cytochrome c oxidase subunit 3 [Acidimicrobiaceae bacterium]MCY4293608.1 cytochrome c oxidase subunit 3 [Acidimicrobiaceae bacterium]
MRTAALPAPVVTRPRTVAVGSLLATGAAFMAFAGLVAIYVQQRQQARATGQEWFPEGSVELGPAGMMMMTLALSVVTVQWAVQAARNEDRPHGFVALAVTLLFGAAVVNQFWFVYSDTAFAIDAGTAQLLFYAVTGSFVAMLVAGSAMLTVTTIRALMGSSGRDLAQGVQAAAVYWHMCVFCYFIVWYVVFINK